MSIHHKIIRAPLITEKNTVLRSDSNKYVFAVDTRATKVEIKGAVEALFNVKVVAVNTMVVKGKKKRVGKFAGYRNDGKKAIVRLAKDQKIEKFGEV